MYKVENLFKLSDNKKNLISKIVLLLLIGCFQPAFGQLTTAIKSKNKTWVIENKAPKKLIRIKIQELKDSSFTALIVDDAMPATLRTYDISGVKKIKFKSRKKMARNIIIGTALGAWVGTGFGLALKSLADDPGLVHENVVFNSGFISAAIGAAIGYGIGSIKVSIPIKGRQWKYQEKRKKIRKNAFKKR